MTGQGATFRDGRLMDIGNFVPGNVTSVAGLGDVDVNGFGDLAILRDDRFFVLLGSDVLDDPDLPENEYFGITLGNFVGAEVLNAGRIDSNTSVDAVISGPTSSWIVLNIGTANQQTIEVPIANLRPVGDLNGDGFSELAAPHVETFSRVNDGDEPTAHSVVHVYSSDQFGPTRPLGDGQPTTSSLVDRNGRRIVR